MGVRATTETGEWECEECGRVFTSLFGVVSGTEPVCPYCREMSRVKALESSHAELLGALTKIRDSFNSDSTNAQVCSRVYFLSKQAIKRAEAKP